MSNGSKGKVATLTLVLGILTAMTVLAFLSPLLYRIFCDVTGYGGTPKIAEQAPGAPEGAREITIRFDSNIDKSLPWEFRAPQPVKVKVGEQGLVNYTSRSLVEQPTWGSASYNVLPDEAGQYFNKIDCFCFTEQKLEAQEFVEMPVTFFVDPAISEDPYLQSLDTITLSYFFYAIEPSEEE